ncbi:hypothetical protein [Clostridium sp. BNL1100]|uniref:hypothetical protein n=1 Tax=Clostridium sp. BNL1100 TaxID=755731 RepID=UPI00024A7DBC|nr:hypothetical protein [Clostridium sp. BNL1100]AEY65377.1 hypothetical protein Clo1100_1125 [Clostridium sp. BNL1100]
MDSKKYQQVKEILLESGIDFLETPKDITLNFCLNYKNNLPEHLYAIITEVLKDLYKEQV